ncbi:MAG: hypothetical protein LUD72_02930 [Bacteroidales bacterium]|nr:hypothetical protein [Bacteroidales bacterium]
MKLISADDLKKELNKLCAFGAIKSSTRDEIKNIIDRLPDMADLTEDRHEDKNTDTHRHNGGINDNYGGTNDNYIIRLC